MQQEREITKLEDLIPHLDSLKELWEREDRFQPVLKLLASLYKDSADRCLGARRTGDAKLEFELAELAAQARVYSMLYSLPEYLKKAKDELENRSRVMEKLKAEQQSFAFSDSTEVQNVPNLGQSYQEALAARRARARMTGQGGGSNA